MTKQTEQEDFVVTARKWRPLRFDSVVGQSHITSTLKNAIKANRIHHAYLFCGPRGVGKTTTARILARAVNCLEPIDLEPCNSCSNCTAVLTGRSIDVIEIDGASNNSVDDIRKLRENSKYAPSHGRYKMYIIDEVHMLSTSAFNALLKTLEEPPPHLLFVFATTESHKVPATIISRCQRFDFRRMEIADISGQLKFIAEKENITIDEESLVTIAKKGDGSMRDSQSIFDQVISFCGSDIKYTEMASALHLIDEEFFFRVSDAISKHDTKEVFNIVQEVISRGYEIQETLQGLLEHFRNILTVIVTGDTKLINTSSMFLQKYTDSTAKFKKADILRYLQIINSTEQALKFMPQPRIRFELALVTMAEMNNALELKDLINEIRTIKSNSNLALGAVGDNEKKKSEIAENKPTAKEADDNKIVASANTDSVEKPIADKSETIVSIVNSDTLKSKWRAFTSQLIKQDASFAVISDTMPSFYDNEIIIQTINDFVAENIKQKTQILESFSQDFFGRMIKFSVVKTENKAVSYQQSVDLSIENKESDNYSSHNTLEAVQEEIVDSNSGDRFKDKHPVEIKIMKLFNAVEIK